MRTAWRHGLTVGALGLLLVATASRLPAAEPLDPKLAVIDEANKTAWYDIRQLGLEGQGWTDVKAPFDRLPAKAEEVVRGPVWGLSRHSTGLCVRFNTASPTIRARWSLTSPNLAMPHMPATGVSGLDLYVRTEQGWQWLANGRPAAADSQVTLVSGLPAGEREYLLYLPLYNGVKSVELGLPLDAALAPAAPRPTGRDKPILFYGTSITQGGCASRPGMVHSAILGRWLDRPVINLGFSGNGRMEVELAELLSELDPAVYVIDCLPNMNAAEVAERVIPFVERLRQSRPDTPILLVEDRSYTDSYLVQSKRERNETSRAALKKCYESLQSAGVKHLHYLAGDKLLGDDAEGTVDSSHPTDLGFWRQAEAFRPALEPLLK